MLNVGKTRIEDFLIDKSKSQTHVRQRTEEEQAVDYIILENKKWNSTHPRHMWRTLNKKKIRARFRAWRKAKAMEANDKV